MRYESRPNSKGYGRAQILRMPVNYPSQISIDPRPDNVKVIICCYFRGSVERVPWLGRDFDYDFLDNRVTALLVESVVTDDRFQRGGYNYHNHEIYYTCEHDIKGRRCIVDVHGRVKLRKVKKIKNKLNKQR